MVSTSGASPLELLDLLWQLLTLSKREQRVSVAGAGCPLWWVGDAVAPLVPQGHPKLPPLITPRGGGSKSGLVAGLREGYKWGFIS